MSNHFQITLATRAATPDVLSVLRRALNQPLMTLKASILAGRPILDEEPHHNDYDDIIKRVTDLPGDLDRRELDYEIRIDGSPESVDYLRNLFARWFEIRRDLQEHDDKSAEADGGA